MRKNNSADEKPFVLRRKSYLAMLHNSPGTQMFRSVIALYRGKERDILHDGDVSCAYFVSSVLKLFDLVSHQHVTVTGTISDMRDHGWYRLGDGDIREGAIVVWKPKLFDSGEEHPHIGFVLSKHKAVSTSSTWGEVVKHRLGWLHGIRHVDAMYWHQNLDDPETN